MKKIIRLITLAVIITVLLCGCGCGNSGNYNGGGYPAEKGDGGSDVVYDNSERKIYYTVNYTLYSDNVTETAKAINGKVAELNGFSYSSREYFDKDSDENKTMEAEYVFKIKTENLSAFMEFMSSFNGRSNKSLTATDITAEYSSAQALITQLDNYITQLNTLYASAATSAEMADILQKINAAETEKAKYEAQMSSYSNLLQYSTVTVMLYENTYENSGFFAEYGEYLGSFFENLFCFIMYALPFAVVCGGITILTVFLVRKSKKQRKNSVRKDKQDKDDK